MAAQRTHDKENEHLIAWVAAGTAVGLIAGALVAERLSGRRLSFSSLFDRGRALATRASARWQPLVDAAIGVRDAWEGNGEEEEFEEVLDEAEGEEDEFDDEELDGDEDLDEDDLEDEDDDLDVDAELDEEDEDDEEEDGEGDEDEDEEFDEDDETDDSADDDATALDARVLEAFSNDPVLAERSVEIEEAANDEIVLHGRVHTAREVAHAVTIARGVPGVAAVRQLLSVRDRR